MSCCNEKLKDSDLVDISHIDDLCMFNSNVNAFLDLTRNKGNIIDCCKTSRFLIRYEEMPNNKFLLTFEDSVLKFVDFIELEKHDKDETIDSSFKRLIRVIDIKEDSRIQEQLGRVVADLTWATSSKLRFRKKVNGSSIFELKDGIHLVMDLTYKDQPLREDVTYITNIERVTFLSSINSLPMVNLFNMLQNRLGFKIENIEKYGTNEESFNVSMHMPLNEFSELNLMFNFVSEIDRALSAKVPQVEIACI